MNAKKVKECLLPLHISALALVCHQYTLVAQLNPSGLKMLDLSIANPLPSFSWRHTLHPIKFRGKLSNYSEV